MSEPDSSENLVAHSLKGRTTYRDYVRKWLSDEDGEIPIQFRKRFAGREAEIAGKMRPGDELWEWEHGEWDALAGTSGLAILRGGQILELWWEWKS